MGGGSSKSTKLKCPECVACPTCPACPKGKSACVPHIVRTLLPLINGYLLSIADQDLGVREGCKTGTLRNISLCNFVKFEIPTTSKTCDLEVLVHGVKGADHIHVSKFEYEMVPETDELLVHLGVYFGTLYAEVSSKPVVKDCSWLAQQATKAIQCDHKTATFGSATNPAELTVTVLIPLKCTKAEEVKVQDLKFELGAFDFDCFKLIGALPAGLNKRLVTLLSAQITTFLQGFVGKLISDAFAKFEITGGSRPRYTRRKK